MQPEITIFAIYAWEDKNVMLQLLRHFNEIKKNYKATIWHDEPIQTGQIWQTKNSTQFTNADAFLLFISSDFMKSQFISQIEFKNVIDTYKEHNTTVIPILVDDCNWEVDFKSDDYNFNLNELDVLPSTGKPIESWSLPEQVFTHVAKSIHKAIAIKKGMDISLVSIEKENLLAKNQPQEQIMLDFGLKEEETISGEVERKTEAEALRIQEIEAENLRKAKQLAAEEAAKKKKAQTEQILKIEEEKQRKEEAVKKQEAEVQRILKTEAAKKAREEELRIAAVATTKRKSEEKRKDAIAAEQSELELAAEKELKGESKLNKRLWIGIVLGLIAVIWGFSSLRREAGGKLLDVPQEETKSEKEKLQTKTVPIESIDENPAVLTEKRTNTAVTKLTIGSTYQNGIVFSVNTLGTKGKLIYIEDSGKMPWKNAMRINEQLGEEWRLPTLKELVLVYNTVGPGGNNQGKFKEELYWTTTAYDKDQARMVRFSDGNTSFHYNRKLQRRKFQVRAVRNFER